jgi:hypothetical protein
MVLFAGPTWSREVSSDEIAAMDRLVRPTKLLPVDDRAFCIKAQRHKAR